MLMCGHVAARCQVEAFMRFFVGKYSADMSYDDNLVSVARTNVCSASGFWFDCITSIPLSYTDLSFYLVPPATRLAEHI